MACGLALLASGQAFAVDYYSKSSIVDADLANPAKWNTDMCDPGGTPATGTTISLGNLDLIYVCPNHSVTLTGATFAVGKLMFSDTTTTWGGGTLKFSTGDKKISNENPSLPQIALNISSMTTGDQIIIDGGTNSITFSGVTGGTLDCGGPYTPGDSISPWTACTVTVTGGGGGGGTVSAPIFSTKEKPAVFSEEVK